MERIIKTDVPGLIKDGVSKAIINTDITKYHDMLRERERSNQIQAIKSDVDSLKNELFNMKTLLGEVASIVKR